MYKALVSRKFASFLTHFSPFGPTLPPENSRSAAAAAAARSGARRSPKSASRPSADVRGSQWDGGNNGGWAAVGTNFFFSPFIFLKKKGQLDIWKHDFPCFIFNDMKYGDSKTCLSFFDVFWPLSFPRKAGAIVEIVVYQWREVFLFRRPHSCHGDFQHPKHHSEWVSAWQMVSLFTIKIT